MKREQLRVLTSCAEKRRGSEADGGHPGCKRRAAAATAATSRAGLSSGGLEFLSALGGVKSSL